MAYTDGHFHDYTLLGQMHEEFEQRGFNPSDG